MVRAQSLISVSELKVLLAALIDKRPDICVRYRILGEMWMVNFMSVLFVSEKGVLFTDDVNHRIVAVQDLSAIMQFEIDRPFNGFQPYFHYEVQPMLDHKEAAGVH